MAPTAKTSGKPAARGAGVPPAAARRSGMQTRASKKREASAAFEAEQEQAEAPTSKKVKATPAAASTAVEGEQPRPLTPASKKRAASAALDEEQGQAAPTASKKAKGSHASGAEEAPAAAASSSSQAWGAEAAPQYPVNSGGNPHWRFMEITIFTEQRNPHITNFFMSQLIQRTWPALRGHPRILSNIGRHIHDARAVYLDSLARATPLTGHERPAVSSAAQAASQRASAAAVPAPAAPASPPPPRRTAPLPRAVVALATDAGPIGPQPALTPASAYLAHAGAEVEELAPGAWVVPTFWRRDRLAEEGTTGQIALRRRTPVEGCVWTDTAAWRLYPSDTVADLYWLIAQPDVFSVLRS